MLSTDPITGYLRSARQLTGAESVSLLYPRVDVSASAVLLHEGIEAPAPELENLQMAEAFIAALDRGEGTGLGDEVLLASHKSSDPSVRLLCISLQSVETLLGQEGQPEALAERRSSEQTATDGKAQETVWLGLRFRDEKRADQLQALEAGWKSARPGLGITQLDALAWNLVFGIYTVRQVYQLAVLLKDPISRLPGRVEFQGFLKQALAEAKQLQQPLGLALINPDDFGHINHRLGRERGDLALQELAEQLQGILRQADALFRYGGAVFGLVMQASNKEEANLAGERIRLALSQQDLLKGAVHLSFSVGVAVFMPDEEGAEQTESSELMRRADRALNAAKLSGGGRTVVWEPGGLASVVENLDRLSGIFMADTEKDYRNMLLLWDTVTVITSHVETQKIATEFVGRLGSTFKPKRIGLYELSDQSELQLMAAYREIATSRKGHDGNADLALSAKQRELLERARHSRRAERQRLSSDGEGGAKVKTIIAYVVPLMARDAYLGCLYLDGPEEDFVLDSSDMIFLGALTNQVAMALDRANLAMRWKQRKEQESRQLKDEVRGLRTALQHSRLIYHSSQMQAVLDVVRRIAPTDTTVLITGESGTGKEVLARTLHEQSQRHTQPFITVDCGAIAQSLMDAELFGHVKGAFTGAQESAIGRIAQADGGTLFLDEIGELPLEVQAKLLRFVQEKELTPVGAASSRKVDVRIIAATNRDLAKESTTGTFRRDLYYRLQVVTLTSPPLRERPDDILPLAYYFLEKYAVQNDKPARKLSPEAEAALLRNPWTGNVRELQNRILQAVVMSDQEEINWQDLDLDESDAVEPSTQASITKIEPSHQSEVETASTAAREMAAKPLAVTQSQMSNPRDALRKGLEIQVKAALESGATPPLGRWLTSDLVLEADAEANGVARQASALLGMAETTFRRQLDKARQELLTGHSLRNTDWPALKRVFRHLIGESPAGGESLMDEVSRILLQELLAQIPHNDNLGSALLGVTKPTYQRRKAALNI